MLAKSIGAIASRRRLNFGLEADSIVPFATNVVLTLLSYLYVLYLYFLDPVEYVFFVTEDSWAEWGAASAFILCAIVLIRGFYRSADFRRPIPILVAIAALLIAGEETSWGQRIFGYDTPETLNKMNWQGEANLHNLLTFQPHAVVGSLILLWMLTGHSLSRRAPALHALFEKLGVPVLPVRVWPLFLLTAIYLIYPPLATVNGDEVAELYLGVALLVLAIDLVAFQVAPTFDLRSYSRTLSVATVAFFVITGVFVAATFDRDLNDDHLGQFAAYRFPAVGDFDQAVEIFEYILEDQARATDEVRYDYALTLGLMGRADEAREVLRNLLAEPHLDTPQVASNVDHARLRAMSLLLLDRASEAQTLLEEILERERRMLASASDARDISSLNWSIAKTLYAMGNADEAAPYIERARETAPDKLAINEIRRWENWQARRVAFIASSNE